MEQHLLPVAGKTHRQCQRTFGKAQRDVPDQDLIE
jgi:hypothetical protein